MTDPATSRDRNVNTQSDDVSIVVSAPPSPQMLFGMTLEEQQDVLFDTLQSFTESE